MSNENKFKAKIQPVLFKILVPFLIVIYWTLIFLVNGCGDLEGEVSSLTISPSTKTVGIKQSESFSATGKDSLGKIITVHPTWSVTGGVGTITTNGLFTAGSQTGVGNIVATVNSLSAGAAVTVTEKCWFAGRVTGDNDSSGVGYVTVKLLGTSYSTTTDPGGNYSLSSIPAGTYDVMASDDRANPIYQSMTSEAQSVASGETKTVNFFLVSRSGLPTIPTTTLPTF